MNNNFYKCNRCNKEELNSKGSLNCICGGELELSNHYRFQKEIKRINNNFPFFSKSLSLEKVMPEKKKAVLLLRSTIDPDITVKYNLKKSIIFDNTYSIFHKDKNITNSSYFKDKQSTLNSSEKLLKKFYTKPIGGINFIKKEIIDKLGLYSFDLSSLQCRDISEYNKEINSIYLQLKVNGHIFIIEKIFKEETDPHYKVTIQINSDFKLEIKFLFDEFKKELHPYKGDLGYKETLDYLLNLYNDIIPQKNNSKKYNTLVNNDFIPILNNPIEEFNHLALSFNKDIINKQLNSNFNTEIIKNQLRIYKTNLAILNQNLNKMEEILLKVKNKEVIPFLNINHKKCEEILSHLSKEYKKLSDIYIIKISRDSLNSNESFLRELKEETI
jgi:hypothetical protein